MTRLSMFVWGTILLGLAALLWFAGDDFLKNRADEMPRFFLAFAGLSGTLMGFVITSMSILVGLRGNKIIDNLTKTGHYPELLENFFWTGVCFFLSMICSIISSFWDNLFLWKFNFMLFIISVIGLVITGNRFRKVMSVINKPSGNPDVLNRY